MASATTKAGATEVSREDRAALVGMEKRLFKLMLEGATSTRWVEWLQAPLEHALALGDEELTVTLLKAGANGGVGSRGYNGRTLLDTVAEGGNGQIVSALLEAGGLKDLNTPCGDGRMTPLHRACVGGHAAAAQVLVFEGADVRLLDARNRSALHYAVEGGHFELARDVVIAGADPNAADSDGNTPLHLAAAQDNYKIVRSLFNRGGDVNVSNSKGQQPLHMAVENAHIKVAETLLKAGADPNARFGENDIHSPLQLASASSAMTQLLLRHGADIKSVDSAGWTALHWAAWSNSNVIDVLVDAGADVDAQSSDVFYNDKYSFSGLTPLHDAAYSRNFETVGALLRKGANVNARDNNGLTPLHIVCKTSAIFADSADMADVLLRWGADETATNEDNRTPVDLIEGGTDLTGRLRWMVAKAPADRAWRRRGLLILCRARSPMIEDTHDSVLSVVVGLEIDSLFRTIVGFL